MDFKAINNEIEHDEVLAELAIARELGASSVKIRTIPIKGKTGPGKGDSKNSKLIHSKILMIARFSF
jgi:hypothetical protein